MISFRDGFELPPFFCPYKPALHPDYDRLERRCIEWCDAVGLYPTPLARAWGINGTRASLLSSYAYPQADPERLYPLLLWSHWVFAVDDAHECENVGTTRPGGPDTSLACTVDLAGRVLCGSAGTTQVVPGSSRYVHAVAAIADQMLAAGASPTHMRRFVHAQQEWMLGELWMATNTDLGRIPTLETFTMQRLGSVGTFPSFALGDFANGGRVRDAELDDPAVRAAINACSLVLGWDNDLISYPKEEFQGDADTNVVTVMAHTLNCSPQDAVAEVVAIRDRVMSLFLALRDQIARTASQDLVRHIDSLGQFTWANIAWSAAIPRYFVINDRQTPPPANWTPVPLDWTDSPSDTSMRPVDIAPIAWWWNTLK